MTPKKMGGFRELTVFWECVNLTLYIYASFVVLIATLDMILFFLVFACALYGLLLRYRIAKPKSSVVNHILGSKWGAYEIFSSNEESHKNEFTMKVVGHRACGLDAPENSLSALKKVFKDGLKTVEFDVNLTADGIPIVFHDETLTRMTDVNKDVNKVTFDEIKLLDISVNHPFGENFKNEKIPTLGEYIEYCLENEIRMFIDLKSDNMKLLPIINELFRKHPKLYELAVVSSFNLFLVYQIRKKDPGIVCSVAWRPFYYSHNEYNGVKGASDPRTSNPIAHFCNCILNSIHQWLLWNFAYYVLGLSAILLHKDMITREMIHYWSKRDVRVIAWSVNLPTEKQYFERSLQISYLTDTLINS